MKTLKLEAENFEEIVSLAVSFLKKGAVLAIPTDTVYGLVCDATNTGAIKKIFRIKQRPKEKILPVFVKDIATARRCAYISDQKATFLEKIWPGAVTAIFHHKGKLPKMLTGEIDTIGLRIPDSPFLLRVLHDINVPLAQTSANISGMPPAKNAEEVEQSFASAKEKPDILVNGGETSGKPSALVDLTRNTPSVLRSGIVTKEELDRLLRWF